MKKYFFLFLIISLASCKPKKNIPDVSAIHIDLQVDRFERDFFALDSSRISDGLDSLQKKYGYFLQDYLFNILGAEPTKDSVIKYVALFKRDYQVFNNAAQQKYPSFIMYEEQIKRGFQFIHYYFPNYKLPKKLITFIGPIEGVGNALTSSGLAIGLQSYLGKNFSAYQTDYISQIYPAYKTNRFEAPYIVVNSMKNIIADMYPDKSNGKALIEKMIEAGKRLYLLDAFLPEVSDTLKTGYTTQQLQGCYENEKNIWSFFIQNNLLYETEINLIGAYINDGPNTPELGEKSPGFIGQFVGWQIVKKWVKKNKPISLQKIMETPPDIIFAESKYKPN